MNDFYPTYKSKLKPWIKFWILKGNKIAPKVLSEVIEGTTPITIEGVYKGTSLQDLIFKGQTVQAEAPSPEAPIPVQVVKEDNYININEDSFRVDLGGKNLLNNTLSSGTNNGITYTVNEDKSVTMNGTATATTWLILNNSISLNAGTYTMSQGNTTNTVRVYCSALSGYCSNGVRTQTITETKTSDIAINIPNGTTISNLTLYPMVEKRKYSNSIQSIYCKPNRTM